MRWGWRVLMTGLVLAVPTTFTLGAVLRDPPAPAPRGTLTMPPSGTEAATPGADTLGPSARGRRPGTDRPAPAPPPARDREVADDEAVRIVRPQPSEVVDDDDDEQGGADAPGRAPRGADTTDADDRDADTDAGTGGGGGGDRDDDEDG